MVAMGLLASLGLAPPTHVAALPTRRAVRRSLQAAVAQGTPRRRPVSGAGTRINLGFLEDTDPNRSLRGSRWYGEPGRAGIAAQMLVDPHVGAAIDAVAAPLLSANSLFRPASKSAIDREIADFCNYAFVERLRWTSIVRSFVQGYVSNGFHLSEMTDDTRAIPVDRFPGHPGGGTGIVPTGFQDVPAWSVRRWFQSKRRVSECAAIEQWIQGSDAEPPAFRSVPSNRLVRLTWLQEGADYTGKAILRRAYQPWKLKIAFLTISGIAHDRLGVGVPMITAAEDATEADLAAAQIILEEMRSHEKGYVILPHGYGFEWTQPASTQQDALERAITRCNIDIAFNVQTGFMNLGLQNKAGSYALGGTQQGQYHLASVGHAKFFCEALNIGSDGWSPVRRIVDLNYGEEHATPTLQMRNLPTRDWQDVAKTYGTLVMQGALRPDARTDDQIRGMLELDPYDDETAYMPQISAAQAGVTDTEPENGAQDDQDETDADSGDVSDEEPTE